MSELRGMYLGLISVAIALFASTPGSCEPRDLVREEQNRNVIRAFYAEKDHLKRLEFLADNYKQHNPMIAGGKRGVEAFFSANEKKYPHATQTLVRIATDGDYVWAHVHTVTHPGDRGFSVINIFRLQNGKIVEHWDVIQPVPASSANDDSMF